MKKINKIFVFFLLSFLFACNSMKEAGKVLRNEKTVSTDEFLVKKREPLVLPPDYKEIPKPGEIKQSEDANKNKFNKIINLSEEKTTTQSRSSSVEQSILNKINK
jgi:hypothetical protein